MIYKTVLKPTFDIVLGCFAFILLIPVFFGFSLILLFLNKGKPFFIQPRPGKNEKIFNIIKFKTMNDKRDIFGILLPDHERLTSFGRFIRKASIDELPQLINVIKGDLSFIGPRPLLIEYLPLYSDFQKRRHEVKPGITGWAQINGRNTITWDEKFKLDVWYVDNNSVFLDIRIIFLTFVKVLNHKDVNASSSTTMEAFTGKNI